MYNKLTMRQSEIKMNCTKKYFIVSVEIGFLSRGLILPRVSNKKKTPRLRFRYQRNNLAILGKLCTIKIINFIDVFVHMAHGLIFFLLCIFKLCYRGKCRALSPTLITTSFNQSFKGWKSFAKYS